MERTPDSANQSVELEEQLTSLKQRLKEAGQYLRIDALKEEKGRLEKELSSESAWADQKSAVAKSVRLGRIEEQIAQFEGLLKEIDDLEELFVIAREENDPTTLSELLKDVKGVSKRVSELEVASLLDGPYDDRGAVVEIHAGAGGTDAQDWASMLLRMYQRWAERRGFDFEVDDVTPGQEAGILSATFLLQGPYAYGLISCEQGVHRLVRISPFDANKRRHTSFASVTALPMVEEDSAEIEIDESEIRVDTFRSSGAGGQHVNKTDSAVRITHIPTGIVVTCQNERSQYQNKQRAMQILKAKLLQLKREEQEKELSELRGPQTEIAWGNQIRSYVLAPYQLVKDLRTGLETSSVEAVLDGDIDSFIEAELKRRRVLKAVEAPIS